MIAALPYQMSLNSDDEVSVAMDLRYQTAALRILVRSCTGANQVSSYITARWGPYQGIYVCLIWKCFQRVAR